MMRVLSLVEKGWAGARQLSIHLARAEGEVEHLVRGRISRDVLAVMTPHPGMRIRGIPRQWYKVIVWIRLFVAQRLRQPSLILIDNERTAQWIDRWFPSLRKSVVLVLEAPDGSPQVFRQGQVIEVGALLPVAAG